MATGLTSLDVAKNLADFGYKMGDTSSAIQQASQATQSSTQQSVQSGQSTATPTPKPSSVIDASSASSVSPLSIPLTKDQVIKNLSTAGISIGNPTGTTVGSNGLASVNPTDTTNASSTSGSTMDWIKDKFKSLGDTLSSKSEVTKALQEENQLAQKTQQAASDYNAYILAKTDLAQKLDNIRSTNPEGQFGSAATSFVSEMERRGNANLANLAIRAQASQNLLTAAQQTIKDKIDAQFQPIQDQIDFLTKFAQVNSNDLTESEKFKLQQQADQKKSELDNLTKTVDTLHQNLLANDAPASAYSAIDKVVYDYTSGKITASDAQTKVYQAAGAYAKKSDAPVTKDINGVTMQWNPTTGKWEQPSISGNSGVDKNSTTLAGAQSNVSNITDLLNSPGLNTSVGTSFLTRGPSGVLGTLGRAASIVGIPSAISGTYRNLTGDRQNFIAGVEQVRSNLNLESLIQAKSRGATFGALSDQELRVLANSATKIGSWAIKDKDGNVIGYNASESDFKKELDKINNFAKLDYIVKGGDPMDVDAQLQSDGSIWSKNSDGTFTQIR